MPRLIPCLHFEVNELRVRRLSTFQFGLNSFINESIPAYKNISLDVKQVNLKVIYEMLKIANVGCSG